MNTADLQRFFWELRRTPRNIGKAALVVATVIGGTVAVRQCGTDLFYPQAQLLADGGYRIAALRSGWLASALIVGILAVVASAVLVGLYLSARRHGHHRVRAELDGLVLATDKIVSSLSHTDREKTLPVLTRDTFVRTILTRNGDVYCERVVEIKAIRGTLLCWETGFAPENEAWPMRLAMDLDLKVTDETASGGKEVASLLSRNDLRDKAILLFFIPRIEPHEEFPRRIKVSYLWPGYYKRLLSTGAEPSSMLLSKEVRSLNYLFKMAPKVGTLGVKVIRPVGGAKEAEPYDPDESGFTGWRYSAENCTAGSELRLQLELADV